MRIRNTQRGSAVLMAVMALVMIGAMGATTMAIVSSHEDSRATSTAMDQAEGLAQAGLEYALNQINMGGAPAVTDKAMGRGTITTTVTPASNLVVAVGKVGEIQKTHSLTTNFAKDCISLDFSTAGASNDKLNAIKIIKSCMDQATIVAWTIGWLPDIAMTNQKLQIQGDVIYDVYEDFSGYQNGQTVDGQDYTILKDNGVTPINFLRFSQNLPDNLTYTITMHFSDGSATTGTFTDN